MSTDTRFNALTDAWLPLAQTAGGTVWASPVEVLCGEKDGVDLDYPRDDFRVYARLLLSALVQALFPAANKTEMSLRLDRPLDRADVMARIEPVLGDFDLFGPTPFLQIVPPAKPPEKGAASFVFPAEDIFRLSVAVHAMSIPVALVMLFTEQTYAGGAGRGYGAGPGGQPGALTLIDTGSVRTAAWANTLAGELRDGSYAADGARAWSNEVRSPRPRAATGLVEGLFFQPRAVWLIAAGEGECSFTGVRGPLVIRSPMLPKSSPTKKPAVGEDLWQHPCAPLAVNSQGIGAVRLSAERPAWTGLAQLLDPLSKADSKKHHPREGAALVLQQWKTLPVRVKRPRMLVLDFDRDKASIKRRFFEAFVLTDQLLGDRRAVERLRDLVRHAQDVRLALVKALTRAHDDRKHGGLALADAESEFWSSSEEPFYDWLERAGAVDMATEESDRRVDEARRHMAQALARTTMRIFDEHVAMSEFSPRQQERVAKARRALQGTLFPRPAAAAPPTHASEVTP